MYPVRVVVATTEHLIHFFPLLITIRLRLLYFLRATATCTYRISVITSFF